MKEITDNSEDLIGDLEEEMFSQKGDIIAQGDYNARTGDIQETILDDDNAFLNVPRLFTVLYFSVRSSRSSALRYGLPSRMSVKTT